MPNLSKKINNKYGSTSARWRMDTFIRGFDNYAKEIPAFNLRGEANVKTLVGGVATLCVFLLTLAYASLKMVYLSSRRNPTVNDSKIDGYFPSSETVNLNEIGWRMAFSIENMETRKQIRDPRYVKWIVRLYKKHPEGLTEQHLPFHRCTTEDLAQFYPLARSAKDEFKSLTEDAHRGLFCLDSWPEDMYIGGDFSSADYQSLDFILTPCNYIHNEMSNYGDKPTPECIPDLRKQLDYMGPLDVVIYMNSERFDQQNFGESSIVKESVILHKQVS